MHARNCVSCVPSELGSTTVMVNYKCTLQHGSSGRKLSHCQAASYHYCTDALYALVHFMVHVRQRQQQL